ncbi:S8 family serine peptidase [bacterium]|nr:S8 family serine peptidase [bacterium]
MSAEENKAVVTLHKGVNADEFLNNMTTTFGSDSIPARSVTIHNEKIDSISNFDFVLTKAEAETLKNDPRVRDVRWGTKTENGIMPMHNVTEPVRNHNRDNTVDNTDYPWAFAECTSRTSRYAGGTTSDYTHAYNLDGTGVDVIIQDSGIEVGHPEWLTRDGVTTRLKQIDWPVESGLSGVYTQGAQHYTDQYGHGTHCASTTAGKLYGWANNADIYAIKIFDTDLYGVSASFNLMRAWHNLKKNDRPTIVNMSWGYFGTYTNIVGGNWRGTTWTGTSAEAQYGMVQRNLFGGLYTHPVRVTSVDSDIEDCIEAGMILVSAAGNAAHKMDLSTGLDYNNYWTSSTLGNRYYHRGGTPQASSNVICTGAIDYNYTNVSPDPEYNNGAFSNVTGNGSDFFKREVTVNGVRIMAAGAVGGQTAVPDSFVEKVARMFELFTDPTGPGINGSAQRGLIQNLSGDAGTYHAGVPTIQRVARGAGSDYSTNFLTDAGIIFWDLTDLFDNTVQNDMVWYLNSTGDGYGDGDIDAQEVIEHVFHTLHMHGLDAQTLKMYPFISSDWATGPLYAAMEEAYDAGKWDPSGYNNPSNDWKTNGDAFEVAAKEYLFLLNFAMFEYTELWENGSLSPEWTDDMRTQSGIQTNNPLGYALHNTYIAPVISRPTLSTIRSIFQDGNTPAQDDPTQAGRSGYFVTQLVKERSTDFSEKGPRVDIFAPGYAIQAAIPSGADLDANSTTHPDNASYKIRKLQGTSMASPQVCGILTQLLQARPHYTQADCLAWLQDQAVDNRLNDPTVGTPSTDYQNFRALNGANNKYLQTPFVSGLKYNFTGGISFSR